MQNQFSEPPTEINQGTQTSFENEPGLFRVIDRERGVQVRFGINEGSSHLLDETGKREKWAFHYTSGDFSCPGVYFASNLKFSVSVKNGQFVEHTFPMIYLIPLDDSLWFYRGRYKRHFGVDPTESNVSSYISDIEHAFQCFSHRDIDFAENQTGRKLEPKILIFNVTGDKTVKDRIDRGTVDERAREILGQAESEEV